MKSTRPLLIAVCVAGSLSCAASFYAVWNTGALSERLKSVSELNTSLLKRQGDGREGDDGITETALNASFEALEIQSARLERELASLKVQVDKSMAAIERIGIVASQALEVAQTVDNFQNIDTETSAEESAESVDAIESLGADGIEELALAHMDFIEAEYSGEPADEQWAQETMNLIEHTLNAQELARTTPVSADCRATMCRIEVEHEDANSQEEFELWFHSFVAGALPTLITHVEDLGDGFSRTRMFMSRQGHELPDAELSAW